MSLLRHQVVITSLEEDFRKFGLIPDNDHGEDLQLTESEEDEESEDEESEGTTEDEEFEDEESEGTTEGEESEDDDEDSAMAEAVAFNESFNRTWGELGKDGIETVFLNEDEMVTMESLAEEVTELPGGVVQEDDEIAESDDEDEDDDDDAAAFDGDIDADVDGDSSAFESVAQAMRTIESLMSEDAKAPEALEDAIPAFANMALVAEHLFGFFAETAEKQEDEEYTEISETYKVIAERSASVVDTLQTEDPEMIDTVILGEVFQDHLNTLLKGLETYAILREADEDEDEEEDEDDTTEDDTTEDDEGNE